jgi:hypothetical protein
MKDSNLSVYTQVIQYQIVMWLLKYYYYYYYLKGSDCGKPEILNNILFRNW